MNLTYLTHKSHPHYPPALALYCAAFPREERREADDALCPHPDFRPGLLTEGDRLQGILFFWESRDFLYLEHFAVLPQYRNLGLGAKALALLQSLGKPIILEIETPVDDLTNRRRGFYLRNGFRENSWPHIQPKYRHGDADLPLVLLSWPQTVSREAWEAFEAYLAANVALQSR